MLETLGTLVRGYVNLLNYQGHLTNSGGTPQNGTFTMDFEVGMGSVSVEPFVFRKACTNDLVVTDDKTFKHAHVHLTANELSRRMAEAIGETFRIACEILDAFLKTKDDPIPDPVAMIRKLAEERKLSQRLTDEIVGRYVAESEPNRFGLINAFTAAAQTLAPVQRIEMERYADTLLTASL